MPKGYCGKILKVDLSINNISIEQPDDEFYRTYMGGSCLGMYYLLKEMEPGIDAFDPRNILVFSISPTVGAPVSGTSRFNITAKSPLTGTIGDSQGGGYWPVELKLAGYDAIVISGCSRVPGYLWISDQNVEIRNAEQLWGLDTGDAQENIRRELGDDHIRIALIGPAGENLVRYACVVNELKHVNGRTGMGAVMGSKRLKAIAVRGTQKIEFHDPEKLHTLAKYAVAEIPNNADVKLLSDLGTAGSILSMQDDGGLPTRNFSSGVFEGAAAISSEHMHQALVKGHETCYACVIHCKRVAQSESPYTIDPIYGGPEYENVASLGSYLGIDNIDAICKANELCNRYTLDTISTGGTIAFAMECFENNLITVKDTDGLDLHFGNYEAVLELIRKIAYREGFGNILADGPVRASKVFGPATENYVMAVKGNPFPAHMARHKASLALAYATNPFGADHQSHEHDYYITPAATQYQRERAYSLGLVKTAPLQTLNMEKVRLFAYSQMAYSILDTLELCQFCYSMWGVYSFEQVVELLKATTGWQVTLWTLMKVGERRINMMRAYNTREGFSSSDDILPQRVFEPLPEGPRKGARIQEQDFISARGTYYEIMGWDMDSGNPRRAKLEELDLAWVADDLVARGLLDA